MPLDLIFYAIFLSQIILVSIFYPRKIFERSSYVLSNYPAEDYPKLYMGAKDTDTASNLRKSFKMHYNICLATAGVGFTLLSLMVVSGYVPSQIKANGHLAFVMLFVFAQAIPYILSAITAQNWQRNIRKSAPPTTRRADLTPRRLFDFVSPIYLAIAVGAFIAWITYYFSNKGFLTPWDWPTYVTVFFMAGMNLIMVLIGYHYLRGKKQNPHQAGKDQRKIIETTLRIFIFASILMSAQLIMMDAINQNGWDMFEPVALSLNIQIAIILGVGEELRHLKVKDMDFNVYRSKTM